ncbi:MAG TPA: phage tail protein [Cyanobacteria bacterium UBA11369]|nr:phage tail protein [Cyanobacteria bacterium UBA11371]HBE29802.1 phage tail protein [Cyanobacteria bacterium UBA11368]HBE48416.1 phage tail protein [Cyanobacteria bacterium UBA11369]
MPRLDYFAPGVYVEEIDRGSRPIEGVQTNIAGFIGFTETIRGGAEIGKPMLVTTWNQYLEYFGKENSDGFTDFNAYLPFAVNGWFLNGGARCWVISIGTQLPKPAEETTQPGPESNALTIKTPAKRESLQFALKEEETNNGSLTVEILPGDPKTIPEDSNTPAPVPAEFFTLVIKREGQELERHQNLTMDRNVQPEIGNYVLTAVQESQYITVTDLTQRGLPLARRPLDGQYEVSPPPELPTQENLARYVQGVRDDRSGIQGLYEIDEITMIACPDLMRAYQAGLLDEDQIHGIMELMISLCENAAPNPPNRMVVLDTPPDRVKPQQVVNWLDDFGRRSMFGALYYPWIKVANPRNNGKPILIPPCGHMMGVWSRIDETRGVYKAPANETPRGVIGLAYDCNFREQELLNPKGINCIRTFPNRGIKIWGARTLVEPEKTEWRYISVRRLMSYIEKSIELGTQWVVFEPNDEDLWARVRRTVSNFLERIWREGALFGASPEQAFYVKCDETINTPDTMILGRLYIEVGVCPVRPAEFVIFRISQWNSRDEE